jgi:hypothetical protein
LNFIESSVFTGFRLFRAWFRQISIVLHKNNIADVSSLGMSRKKGFVSINKLKKCGKYFPSKYVKFYVGFALVLISIYLFLLKMAIILCGLYSGAN